MVLADLTTNDSHMSSPSSKHLAAFGDSKNFWEEHFNTEKIININKNTWIGALKIPIFILLTLLFKKFSREDRKEWFNMAIGCRSVALNLLIKRLRYDLIVLKKPL